MIMLAFRDAFRMIETRLKLFTALPLSKLSSVAIQRKVDEIGRMRPDSAEGVAS
jgi:arsenate reductase